MRGRVSAGLLLIATLQGCADDGPSSPSSLPSSGSASNLPPSSGTALRARVVNAVTGSPVGGASITVEGGSPITADSLGIFRLDRSTGGSVRVVVEASGYWPRETGMRPTSGSVPLATLSLMPDGDDFDLAFYDHVFRDLGEEGTHPWATEPRFEIWEGRYECTAFVDSAACDELTAVESRAPAAFFDTLRGVIGADARRYTDGHVLGSNITTRAHPPGTVLTRSQFIEPGRVSIAYVSTRDNFSWTLWRYNNSGPMIGAHINLNARHLSRRGVYSHELAHSLGFNHPLGLDRVPLNSIMRQGHGDEPTRIDILHGRVLYSRPGGSRTPDIDPMTFLLSTLRGSEGLTGGETTRAAP